MMNAIQTGTKAPDFRLEDNQGGTVKLSDYRGKKVLLSWHPLAWTGVCTDQMRALETHYETFEKLGAVALGMSVDSAPCKKAWGCAICVRKTKLPADFYPLGKVARDYGVFLEEQGTSARANIIIDGEGIVRWVKVYPGPQLPDIDEVLKALEDVK